jgi:hypothetical protein
MQLDGLLGHGLSVAPGRCFAVPETKEAAVPNYNTSWQVTDYSLTQWTGATGQTKAVVALRSAQGHDGYIIFLESGPVPANTLDQNGNLRMHATIDQFHSMMEMLREEKPIWVGGLLYGWNGISTNPEPVGEEEGALG